MRKVMLLSKTITSVTHFIDTTVTQTLRMTSALRIIRIKTTPLLLDLLEVQLVPITKRLCCTFELVYESSVSFKKSNLKCHLPNKKATAVMSIIQVPI